MISPIYLGRSKGVISLMRGSTVIILLFLNITLPSAPRINHRISAAIVKNFTFTFTFTFSIVFITLFKVQQLESGGGYILIEQSQKKERKKETLQKRNCIYQPHDNISVLPPTLTPSTHLICIAFQRHLPPLSSPIQHSSSCESFPAANLNLTLLS